MHIRAFREDDLDELHSMICSTIEQNYRGVYSPKMVDFFKEYHSEKNIRTDASLGHTIVAVQNGSIVGSGTLLGNNIRRVFVLPDRQGKGIGGRIMTELEQKAQEGQIKVVELDSSMVSVDFYHRLGYDGDCQAFIELENGDRLDYVPMTKKIRQR
jgi:citrate lyase synthetase